MFMCQIDLISRMAKKLNIFNRFNKKNKMTDKETGNQEELEQNETVENTTEEQPTEEVKKEETPEEKIAELNNRYLRLYSEFDNYRKRTAKEKLDIITTANAGVMKDILGTVDDFKRAMQANEKVEDVATLKDGFELIFNKFYKTLESKGLKAIEAKGEPFNADVHEAITNIPAPTEDLKGKVVDVIEEGYMLGEKIIRFPKVVVGQ